MGQLGPDVVWLRISPVLGNSGYGGAICGEVRATPTPEPTPEETGPGPDPSSCPPRGPNRCTPAPTVQTELGDGGAATLGIEGLVPVFAVTGMVGSLPLAASGLRYLQRRRRR
jgi:hypothetical protein